jgi:hypothetical protein
MLFLSIGLTSMGVAKLVDSQDRQAVLDGRQLTEKLASLKKDQQDFEAIALNEQSSPRKVALTLAQAMTRLTAEPPHRGIAIQSKEWLTKGDKREPLVELVPHTPLRSAKLLMQGTYTAYPDLIAYLTEIQALPAAVSYLQVSGHSFNISIRAYGL